MLAIQTYLPDSQIALVMAILVFVQGLGGSIFITVANTILDNSIVSQIQSKAPGVNAQAVLAVGATAFREVVPADQVGAVISAYSISFNNVFYLATGLSIVTCFTIWGLGWGDVRKKKGKEEAAAASGSSQTAEGEKGDTNV